LEQRAISNFLEQRAMSKITSGQNAVCWFDTDPGPQSLVYCPVDNTLFEVSPEICCSAVSCLYCGYGNYTAGSKQI